MFTSPADAIRHGIGMIHQHFKLVEAMTALENILVGEKGVFSIKANAGRVLGVAARFDLSVDLDRRVYEMSVGEADLGHSQVLSRGGACSCAG